MSQYSNEDMTQLHVHGEYSQLDAVGTVSSHVKTAKNMGFRALAQTDHGTVSGALKHYHECVKNDIKPLCGVELYISDDTTVKGGTGRDREKLYHTIAIAKDWDGFVSLQKLLTQAHSEQGYYYKPRNSWEQLYQLKNCIVTTACVGGPLSHPDWKQKASEYNDVFGEDFYCELQPHNMEDDLQINNNHRAIEIAKHFGRKTIATNDCHYADEQGSFAQEALLGIRDKTTVTSEDKWEFTKGLYMRSFDDMMNSFKVIESKNSQINQEMAYNALRNTTEIVEKCNFVLPKFDISLPDVDTSELGTEDPDRALMLLCGNGWKKRFDFEQASDQGKIYFQRLNKELETIIRLKFSKYFLLVWDIYKYCRKVGIATGAGRGSGAGSLVCYLLGITNADPIHYGLIFERFVNPERVDIPDLDLDFQHDRREEVYQYILTTYKHVAHISTFSNMNTKGVLKDVSRFREVPLAEADAVSKEINVNTAKQDLAGITLKILEDNPNKYPIYKAFKERNGSVVNIAKVLEGQVRQSGVHAGGVIVSNVPLEDRCSVEWRKGQVCINFDMHDMNHLGLLKVDVLGLKTVTILDNTLKLVNEKSKLLWNKTFELEDIPLDDPKTLANFDKGNTIGVFQFESQGMQQMLKEMAPHDINTVITANAMYRPGPLQFKDLYVKQKKNPSLIISTGNDALDIITKETYGVFIYQEQVMRIAVDVAGFTYPEADVLRKKISKSKGKAEIETSRDKFVDGCVDFGKLDRAVSNKIFDQIVDFGRYAFNKSHATTYSISSYYAMWFKTHFPHEFMLSQIKYSDDKEERIKFITETKRIGLQYVSPDINLSEAGCSIQHKDGKQYLLGGLAEVEGIGNIVVSEVLKTRGDNKFDSFHDFFNRLENKRAVNVGAQEKLLQSGVFNSLHNPTEVKQINFDLRNNKIKSAKKKIVVETMGLFG